MGIRRGRRERVVALSAAHLQRESRLRRPKRGVGAPLLVEEQRVRAERPPSRPRRLRLEQPGQELELPPRREREREAERGVGDVPREDEGLGQHHRPEGVLQPRHLARGRSRARRQIEAELAQPLRVGLGRRRLRSDAQGRLRLRGLEAELHGQARPAAVRELQRDHGVATGHQLGQPALDRLAARADGDVESRLALPLLERAGAEVLGGELQR
mmetsp:Transcript_26601/g.67509  ORF Transcript_26601/g.67509 Transcript_26601/m.67509 type:complete len:214 (+) Transcript_26601:2796-3437(+)